MVRCASAASVCHSVNSDSAPNTSPCQPNNCPDGAAARTAAITRGSPATAATMRMARRRVSEAPLPPSPQSKSAVADFDRFIEWPKPAYTRFRLGEGRGGGSCRGGTAVFHSSTPTPDPSPQGGGEQKGPQVHDPTAGGYNRRL